MNNLSGSKLNTQNSSGKLDLAAKASTLARIQGHGICWNMLEHAGTCWDMLGHGNTVPALNY